MDRKSAPPTRPGMGAGGAPSGPPNGPDDDEYDLRGGFGGRPPVPPAAVRPAVEADPPRPGRSTTSWRLAVIAGGVLVLAIAVIAVLAFRLGNSSSTTSQNSDTTTTSPTTATTLPVTDIYQRVAPSVVLITTTKGSLGTGVIITDTGTILTANHVISDGSAVTLQFSDGTKAAARVASTNPAIDVATLTPAGLPEVVVPAVLGGAATVGSDVVAIGNPLGFTDSTSSGIVSGLDRTAKTEVGRFSGLIQFDAAVNPGSSGGPLLDSKGLVIGVVVSIANPAEDDSFAGIGFAVPIAGALGGGSGEGPGGGPQI